ncbi:MAG: RRF2-family transcriptional regulator [Deltaproteobacteria bacterium]|nr:RRF2-family transcriptional regulator [Deltaproteobacteria bacterium]
MIDLAINGANGVPVFLSDIAKRQSVSEKYLEHIFSALHKGGLVKAQRGRKGGYLLDGAADQITILDIITILEGPCTLVDCVQDSAVCDKSSICVTRDIWNRLGAAVRQILSGYTLASLVEMQELKGQQDTMMYYI